MDAALQALSSIATPRDQGLDPREVLFSGVQTLAYAGGQAHALGDLLGRLQALLAQMEAQGVDPRPFLKLEFELTKRKAHAAVGFCEGVCTAGDVALWNRPEFLQCVFWDEEGTAQGGMHLLIAEEQGRRYLTLPGINPSVRLLARVEAAVMLEAVMDYGWRLARKLGLQGAWVPASPAIHSNRRAIHEELERRGWPLRVCQAHPFSTEPYRYVFDQVLEVPSS